MLPFTTLTTELPYAKNCRSLKQLIKSHTLDTAPHSKASSPQQRSGMSCIVKGFQIYLHTSDILVLKLILVLVFILFSNENFYFIQF